MRASFFNYSLLPTADSHPAPWHDLIPGILDHHTHLIQLKCYQVSESGLVGHIGAVVKIDELVKLILHRKADQL